MTPVQAALMLRFPIEHHHTQADIYERIFEGLACMIEQNQKIVELLDRTGTERATK